MGFWAALGRLFIKEVAPVLAEKGAEALEHRLNRPKPAPVPRVEPLGDTVVPPPFIEPVPLSVALPKPAPTREWEGWDVDNLFTEKDLTKLAAETGESRDDLLTSRNAMFAVLEKQYRRAAEKAGRRTNASSAGIFASESFKIFVQTGELTD